MFKVSSRNSQSSLVSSKSSWSEFTNKRLNRTCTEIVKPFLQYIPLSFSTTMNDRTGISNDSQRVFFFWIPPNLLPELRPSSNLIYCTPRAFIERQQRSSSGKQYGHKIIHMYPCARQNPRIVLQGFGEKQLRDNFIRNNTYKPNYLWWNLQIKSSLKCLESRWELLTHPKTFLL